MSERTYYSEEAKKSQQVKIAALAAFCLAIGTTIGTVIAVLFTPQSGEDTREELEEASASTLDKLQTQVDDLRKRFEKLAS